ncbi:MAG: sigma-70 family RNA polymerase sigma factor [Burkholderiales bacterium]|nr:sigma-70 family RNA polymerase sigma factor [Opitutaceae bacterium]
MSPADHELLRSFVAGDHAAFAMLVRRHERMVYSTALRYLDGDAAAAQDAAQQTFLLLARHAARLRSAVIIGGWLHHAACHQAETLRRSMHRRRLREEVAASDPSLATATAASTGETTWCELAPQLDAALDRLPSRLRDAVVLCLLQSQDRPAAAAQLGCTPDALAKRLARALDQLRAHFARRGATVSAAALAALLSQHGSEAHAAGLAPAVLTAPLAPDAPFWSGSLLLKSAAVLAIIGAGFALFPNGSPQAATPASPSAPIVLERPNPEPAIARPVASPALAPLQNQAASSSPDASVPSSNPYAPALAIFAGWSAADQKAAREGQALSPAARATLPAIAASLKAGAATPEVDWGVNYEQGLATPLPHLGATRALARATLQAGEALSLEARLDNALGVLALGRHLGREGCLIELLTGIAVTDQTAKALDAMLPALSPDDARRVAESMRALPSDGSLATALAFEKTFFVDGVAQALHTELFSALGPTAGLYAPPASGSTAADFLHATTDETFSALPSLRLSGVLQEPSGTAISLEGPQGAFWLRPGETRDEFTLLEASVERRRATLLFRGRPLLLDLESRRFSMPALDVLEAASRRLPPDSLCALLIRVHPSGSLADFLREMEETARQLGALYAEAVAAPARFTDEEAYRERITTLGPLARATAVALPSLLKRLQKHEETRAALLARLDARAAETVPETPGPPGPTSTSPRS